MPALPLNQILLGDAIEQMKLLPDDSIDALISDPPYSTTAISWD
ncbi:MAG: site-specific DNA-methyltransferase, partial [Microcoleus sp. SIO2G3]|nr:site-specific DNA-methyltransferase [Microcoleus sp. SIO2G3]